MGTFQTLAKSLSFRTNSLLPLLQQGRLWLCKLRLLLGARPHLHFVWIIVLGLPIGDPAHSGLPIAKFLAEGSILGLGVATAVRIMESNVEKKRPEELTREG